MIDVQPEIDMKILYRFTKSESNLFRISDLNDCFFKTFLYVHQCLFFTHKLALLSTLYSLQYSSSFAPIDEKLEIKGLPRLHFKSCTFYWTG